MRTRKTQRDSQKSRGQNITVYVQSPAPSHTQTLSNPFRTFAIKWEVYILLKKSSCVFSSRVCLYHCVGMYPVYICIFLPESADDNITDVPIVLSLSQIDLFEIKSVFFKKTKMNGFGEFSLRNLAIRSTVYRCTVSKEINNDVSNRVPGAS